MNVEISVRTFYEGDEASVAPKLTAVVSDEGGQAIDWDKVIKHLVKACELQLKDIPITALKPMTRKQIDAYRKDEADGDPNIFKVAL